MGRGGRRFLVAGMGALAAATASGRLISWRDARRPDPAREDELGSFRGEPRVIRGPRATQLYTEWLPSSGGVGTVVFTHGYCLTEAVWHYQKRDLSGGRFGVASWDLPGHGHSPGLAPGSLTLEYCADALAKVIDEYSDGNVVLVGHSLGGVVTMGYLARHARTAAKAVRGVVLVSTPMMHFATSIAGRWPGAGVEAHAIGSVMQYVVESDLTERVLGKDMGRDELGMSYRMVRWGFGRQPSPSQVLFVRDSIAHVRPDVRAETYRIMTGYDLTPVLAEVKVPTLVMIGDRDRLVNPRESMAMARALPNATGVRFTDAGHAVFLEEHERFNDEIRRFAERRLRRRGKQGGTQTA